MFAKLEDAKTALSALMLARFHSLRQHHDDAPASHLSFQNISSPHFILLLVPTAFIGRPLIALYFIYSIYFSC
jgi:hypothetical protein